jgi:hypothetical protein
MPAPHSTAHRVVKLVRAGSGVLNYKPPRRGGPLRPPARYDNLARLAFLLMDRYPLIIPPRIALLRWFDVGSGDLNHKSSA